jgi:tryptophan-rich sensory protein
MRKIVLRTDAVFLWIAGLFGLVADVLSYYFGSGPFREVFLANSTVIGVVEAHALAMLIAAVLWHVSNNHRTNVGGWMGLSAHAIMGVSNLVWFDLFVRVESEVQGFAVTFLHFMFVALHAFVIATRPIQRGESIASR